MSREQATPFITPYTDPGALSGGTLLTQDDIAIICRVSVDTVKRWRARGDGPRFVPIGKTPLYRADDFTAWLANRVSSAPPPPDASAPGKLG